MESPQLQALLADIAPADLRDAAYSTYYALAFGVGSPWVIGSGWVIVAAGESDGLGIVFWLMVAGAVAAALHCPDPARRGARGGSGLSGWHTTARGRQGPARRG